MQKKYSHHISNITKTKGNFPHYCRAGDFVYISGTSARKKDNSIEGAIIDNNYECILDIAAQTHAVINNIKNIISYINADLTDIVDITTFLTDMNNFKIYNKIYNEYFSINNGPARTTVAVHQLPIAYLLIEIKAVVYKPLNNMGIKISDI
jgi:2-aminomuconate deaminase